MAKAKTPKSGAAAPAATPEKTAFAAAAEKAAAAPVIIAVPEAESPAKIDPIAAAVPPQEVSLLAAPVALPTPPPAAEPVPPAQLESVPIAGNLAHLGAVAEPVPLSLDDLLNFGKENAEALIAAGHGFSLALSELAHSVMSWSQDNLEHGIAAGQALVDAKSVQDVVDLSQNVAQKSLDKVLNESVRLYTQSTGLLRQAYSPLQDRVAAAVEKLTRHAA
jgi:hypothetical protein